MSDNQTTTALATITADPNRAPTGRDLILQADNLNAMVRVSDMMSKSRNTVPKHLRDNQGGCLAVTMQAMRWNMDPFALAQKTYTVNADAPVAYEGQAIIAALNNSPLLATRLNFEWFGDWTKIVGKFKEVTSTKKKDDEGQFKKYIVPDWNIEDEKGLGVRVWSTLVGEKEPRVMELLMTQVRTRNSGLWTEDPKQQIGYLSGRRWGRLHAPDVIMGVYTPEELEEFQPPKHMGDAEIVPPAAPPVPEALLAAAKGAADKGRDAFADWWKKATPPERTLLQYELAGLQTRTEAAEKARTVENGDAGAAPAKTAAAASTVTDAAVKPAAAAKQTSGLPTAASIEEKMRNAKSQTALDIAADWIKELPDAADKQRLNALYDTLLAPLTAAAEATAK